MKTFFVKHTRIATQFIWTFLSNCYVQNFATGFLYKGKTKFICAPGLNCYSCPAAGFACPLGSLQSCFGDLGTFAYVAGIILVFSVLLGRKICGFLCPFGLLQDLLYKIPGKKINNRLIPKQASKAKYLILAVFVVIIPIITSLDFMTMPAFCKFLCPQGIIQAAIPISAANAQIRASLGIFFWIKLAITLTICILSVIILRPFCKFICPLGAIYGLFNRFCLSNLKIDEEKCTGCGACVASCKMNCSKINDSECIRCGECKSACNFNAIQ